jgi:hypothetical protein
VALQAVGFNGVYVPLLVDDMKVFLKVTRAVRVFGRMRHCISLMEPLPQFCHFTIKQIVLVWGLRT